MACWIITRSDTTVTSDEIRDFCRASSAHFKVPRYIEFATEIPMTVAGKALKLRMREAMVAKPGLAEIKTA